jgi:hypothetical protein
MKLFAATLLAAVPATAQADTTRQATSSAREAQRVDWNGYIDVETIKPRLLANKRPAVGNTGGKSDTYYPDYEVTPERKALLHAAAMYRYAKDQPIVTPRLLANHRPACGNTGGKVKQPSDCTAAEIRAVNAYNDAYEQASSKHYAKVSSTYGKLMVAVKAAVKADPSLKMRLLHNGRPACGNTQGKKGPPEYCREGGS